MVRPAKDPADTVRGQKKLRAIEKQKVREAKKKKKEETKRLFAQGLCRAPDNTICTFKQVGHFGAKYGTAAWNHASESQKQARKNAGKETWDNASESEKNRLIIKQLFKNKN